MGYPGDCSYSTCAQCQASASGHHRWLRHQSALRLCTTGRPFQSQDAPQLSERNVRPVPPEIMLGCFVVAGLIVAIVYSIDWSSVF
jgi:hypothetical protein